MPKGPKVYIVEHDYKADYKVCFVNSSSKEKNTHLLDGGELVKKDYQADVKVFITDKEYKADIKIQRKNFPEEK